MISASFRKKIIVGSFSVFLLFATESSAGLLGLLLPGLPLPLPLQLFTTLAWNPSPSPQVVGYALYHRIAGLPFTNRIDVGKKLSVTLPLLVGSAYSIHVVAYTAEGVESPPSNVVNYTPPSVTPLKLSRLPDGSAQVRFRTSPLAVCRVEWTPTLFPPAWRPLGLGLAVANLNGDVIVSDSGAASSPARFYRAVKL